MFFCLASGVRKLLVLEERMNCSCSRANLSCQWLSGTRGMVLFFKWAINFLCSMELTKTNLAKANLELLVVFMVREIKAELCFADFSK